MSRLLAKVAQGQCALKKGVLIQSKGSSPFKSNDQSSRSHGHERMRADIGAGRKYSDTYVRDNFVFNMKDRTIDKQ